MFPCHPPSYNLLKRLLISVKIQQKYNNKKNHIYILSLLQEVSLQEMKDKNTLKKGIGPCVQRLDEILNSLNVQRQAYHGKSFVGNHVHKMLQVHFTTSTTSNILSDSVFILLFFIFFQLEIIIFLLLLGNLIPGIFKFIVSLGGKLR